VKLYVSNASGADSLLKNNHIAISSVTAPPVVEFSATKTNPIVNEVISLIDLSTNTPTTWKWRISPVNYIFMNGTDSTSKIPNIKFTNGDNFTITLIATNAEGSSQLTKVDYIKVNGSFINRLTSTQFLSLYPNPASTVVYADTKGASSLMVSDMFGRVLKVVSVDNDTTELAVDEFQNGTYYISIVKNNEKISAKLIINH
jgi:PKD repeat protein